jgi:hypothetical protein
MNTEANHFFVDAKISVETEKILQANNPAKSSVNIISKTVDQGNPEPLRRKQLQKWACTIFFRFLALAECLPSVSKFLRETSSSLETVGDSFAASCFR